MRLLNADRTPAQEGTKTSRMPDLSWTLLARDERMSALPYLKLSSRLSGLSNFPVTIPYVSDRKAVSIRRWRTLVSTFQFKLFFEMKRWPQPGRAAECKHDNALRLSFRAAERGTCDPIQSADAGSCPRAADLSEPANIEWCPRPDSNRHSFQNRILNPARLPIPPLGQGDTPIARSS